MVMQMLTIQVSSNDHLEPISEQPLCELDANLMGQFRCQFSGFEGLDDVITLYAVSFVIALFGSLHIPAGVFYAAAIQAALKQPLFGFVWIDSIINQAIQQGLFFIGSILNCFLKCAVDGKYFGDCHIRIP